MFDDSVVESELEEDACQSVETEKAGAGTNMQERLAALHHLDGPWRPSDVEQREGRVLRPMNRFAEVRIFNYVTEQSFDVYIWQTLESKFCHSYTS